MKTQLPITSLPQFIRLHPISLSSISAVTLPEPLGTGLQCISPPIPDTPLLRIDPSLILTSETLEIARKYDRRLNEAIATASGPNTTRAPLRLKAIIFLIMRMNNTGGASDVWSEYVNFLPLHVPLPTLWTAEERALLSGTSLHSAVSAKLSALDTEFCVFRDAHGETEATLLEWTLADAWFRSRSLGFPEPVGEAMVPVLDFANHSEAPNAWYEVEERGDVVLFPRGKLEVGEEATIDYAAGEKSAAEMLFSYGFIPSGMEGARCLQLPLACAGDDPFRRAKEAVFRGARVLKISEGREGEVGWESELVWLAVVNEEDGLDFNVLQTVDGKRELQMSWLGNPAGDVSEFRKKLERERLWPVYELRAVVMVQERIGEQLTELREAEEGCNMLQEMGAVGDGPWDVAKKLRELEGRLMENVIEALEVQKDDLLQNEVVIQYLRKMQGLDVGDGPDLS